MDEAVLDLKESADVTVYSLGILEVIINNVVNHYSEFDKGKANDTVREFMEYLSQQVNDEIEEKGFNGQEVRFIYDIDETEFGSIFSKISPKLEVVDDFFNVVGVIGLVLGVLSSKSLETLYLCYDSEAIYCEVTLETKQLSAFIKVKESDSVSRIIKDEELANGVTYEQVAVALFEYNPHAFPTDNINVLSVGTILLIPPKETIEKYSAYKAANLYKEYGGY